jgi:hypothetical protein
MHKQLYFTLVKKGAKGITEIHHGMNISQTQVTIEI